MSNGNVEAAGNSADLAGKEERKEGVGKGQGNELESGSEVKEGDGRCVESQGARKEEDEQRSTEENRSGNNVSTEKMEEKDQGGEGSSSKEADLDQTSRGDRKGEEEVKVAKTDHGGKDDGERSEDSSDLHVGTISGGDRSDSGVKIKSPKERKHFGLRSFIPPSLKKSASMPHQKGQ